MAKTTKKNGRSKRKFTLPLAAVAGFAPGVIGPLMFLKDQGPTAASRELARIWTGYDYTDGSFDWGRMKWGLLPAVVGMVVHKLANKFGLNRALGSIPIVRI